MSCFTPFVKWDEVRMKNICFPCGKCPECVARRVSAWSFRLMQESKVSLSAHFITMTYGNKNLPITKNGFATLNKRHVQLFFKRLRKAHVGKYEGRRLKYYAVGEYGTKSRRPHYHIILFNADVNLVEPAWNLGQCHFGEVTGASVGYTMKYISKSWKPMHRNDDRLPQFALMSKGLGSSYITDQIKKWHVADLDNRMVCVLDDGRKISMCRYYKDRIYTEEQRERVAEVQAALAIERENKRWNQSKEEVHNELESHIRLFNKMRIDHEKDRSL